MYDAIIIGGGHNGLTAAAYLAKAGRKVLVLERRHILGGAAASDELYPGFTYTLYVPPPVMNSIPASHTPFTPMW